MGGKYCHCTGKCLTLRLKKDEACLRPIVAPTSPVFFKIKGTTKVACAETTALIRQ